MIDDVENIIQDIVLYVYDRLNEFACGWIGGWVLAGCILTAVDGLHACGRCVLIDSVGMYCNNITASKLILDC